MARRPVDALIEEIEADAARAAPWTGRTRIAPGVLRALRRVPRHAFVPEAERGLAYANHALPIGSGQTISQPFIVALMTDLLDIAAQDVVLEIGTGSGYQAAVLAELARHVYSVEIVPALADRARRTLESLGYDNIALHVGDGAAGWPEHAPYDAIIVTAAAPAIPQALLKQLKPGGRLIAPVGPAHGDQSLVLVAKQSDGSARERAVLPVAFVPLVGAPPPGADS